VSRFHYDMRVGALHSFYLKRSLHAPESEWKWFGSRTAMLRAAQLLPESQFPLLQFLADTHGHRKEFRTLADRLAARPVVAQNIPGRASTPLSNV
jgi:hypothetical protein